MSSPVSLAHSTKMKTSPPAAVPLQSFNSRGLEDEGDGEGEVQKCNRCASHNLFYFF